MSSFHAVCGESAAVDEDGKIAWRKDQGKRAEGRAIVFSSQPLRDGVNFSISVEESKFPWMSLGVTSFDPASLEVLPARARMLSDSVVLHPGGLYINGLPISEEKSINPMSTTPGDTWTLNWTNSALQFSHNNRTLSWMVDKEEKNIVQDLEGDLWAVVELGLGTKVSIVPGYVLSTYYQGPEEETVVDQEPEPGETGVNGDLKTDGTQSGRNGVNGTIDQDSSDSDDYMPKAMDISQLD